MGRPKYPSDHRPWFKMEEDILHHPALLQATPDEAWAWCKLRAVANQRGATDGVMWIANRDLAFIIGAKKRDKVVRKVRNATKIGLISAALYSEMWLIIVHKLADIQEFTPAKLRRTPGTKTKKGSAEAAPERAERVSDPPSSDPRPADDTQEVVSEKPPTPTERARAVWPRLVAAAGRHGKTWQLKPSKAATSMIAARIREGVSDDQLEAVIHGAIQHWGPANGNWNPLDHLEAQKIYQPSKWEGHLEAYQARTQTQSLDDQVAATRAKIRAEHARERREGAQA